VAQPYLQRLQELVSARHASRGALVCKHFFSGAALYAEGIICASLTPKGLAFKLPKPRCEELIALGKASALRYFDKSPVKAGYILLPDFGALSDAELDSYFEECLVHASR